MFVGIKLHKRFESCARAHVVSVIRVAHATRACDVPLTFSLLSALSALSALFPSALLSFLCLFLSFFSPCLYLLFTLYFLPRAPVHWVKMSALLLA